MGGTRKEGQRNGNSLISNPDYEKGKESVGGRQDKRGREGHGIPEGADTSVEQRRICAKKRDRGKSWHKERETTSGIMEIPTSANNQVGSQCRDINLWGVDDLEHGKTYFYLGGLDRGNSARQKS